MQAVVEQAGQLLRRAVRRQVGTSDVADEQGVPGEHRVRLGRLPKIGDHDRDALGGVSGGLQEAQPAVPEMDFVAVVDRHVGKLGAGLHAEVNASAGQGGQLAMPRDEIGVEVSLDYMLDLEAMPCGVFDIDAHIALRINHRGDTPGTDQVRGVRQASQVKLLEVHWRSLPAITRITGNGRRADKKFLRHLEPGPAQGCLNALGIFSGVSGRAARPRARSPRLPVTVGVRGSKPLKFSGNSRLTY